MKNITSSLLIFFLAVVLFAACTQNKASEMLVDKNLVAVRLDTVRLEEVAKPVRTSGLIASETESTVSFKTGGIVQATHVKAGDAVKQGQLLASLNLTEIQAQVVQATNSLEKATRDLQRFEQLYKDSAATLEQLQNITTLHQNARETHRIANFNLSNSQIRAPFDGVVLKKWVNAGEMVASGNPVFSLSARNQSAWVLKAGVSDRDWARLSLADSAMVSFDHLQEPLIARVRRIAQGADPANGTYQAELELAAGKNTMLANGLVGSVTIFPSKKSHVSIIPIESIVEGNGNSAYVYLPEKGNTVIKHPIKVAYFSGETVAVASGLENVPLVVSAGSAYLNTGSTIMVVK